MGTWRVSCRHGLGPRYWYSVPLSFISLRSMGYLTFLNGAQAPRARSAARPNSPAHCCGTLSRQTFGRHPGQDCNCESDNKTLPFESLPFKAESKNKNLRRTRHNPILEHQHQHSLFLPVSFLVARSLGYSGLQLVLTRLVVRLS